MIAVKLAVLLAACTLISAALSDNSNSDIIEESQEPFSRPTINEDLDYINNVMDGYRRHINPRFNTDFNAPRNQEMLKVWKRNADIINTLLGFPRRMLLAGR